MEQRPKWNFIDLIMIYAGTLIISSSFSWWIQRGGGAALFSRAEPGGFGCFVIAYAMQVVTIVALIAATIVWRGAGIKDLGLCRSSVRNWMKYGLMGGILATLFILFSGAVIHILNPNLPPQSFEVMLRAHRSPEDYILLLLLGSVLAPLSEELFYRGMIYPVFKFHLGKGWGMAAAGAVFGLAHWDMWRALPLAMGGAFLCYIYEKSGSVLVSALSHGIWNGALTIVVYFAVNSNYI